MELIRDALALPDDTTIIDIQRYTDHPFVYTFVIEHPDAPVFFENQSIIKIEPHFRVDNTKRPSSWIDCDLFGEQEGI
jgi:hypothetical protein